jgi:NADH-quinone oxidoreductase subunit L
VLAGAGIGWLLYGNEKETQEARDTFRIPVLWPLFENLYYIDDFYMNGIVRPIMGPVAKAVLWWDMYVVDGIVNGVGLGSLGLAKAVKVVDQNVVDGVYNELGAGVDGLGNSLRRSFTGRIQQYAAFSFIGVVIFAVLFIIL